MSWLSKALGRDKRTEKQQLQEWQGAGPERRFRESTISEGDRAQQREGAYQQSRGGYMDLLQNGQQAFNESARAAVAAAMPQFNSALNGVRESAIRRGVQNGELGTSYEGDLASALSRNLDNSISSQALGLYNSRLQGYGHLSGQDLDAEEASSNRYNDLITGNLDLQDQKRQRKKQNQGQLGSIIGAGIGFIPGIGTAIGGPAGGAALGGALGGLG